MDSKCTVSRYVSNCRLLYLIVWSTQREQLCSHRSIPVPNELYDFIVIGT